MRIRCREYEEQPELIRSILAEGADKARDVAEDTLRDVRDAMGLGYR
jgi:tryptophanyl-tRNA synthetase